VNGDRVWLFFYTDGSCTRWGYKFTVTPVYPKTSSAKSSDKLSQIAHLDTALWILDFVDSFDELPEPLKIF
jgi:hypothetical protein